MGQRYKAYACRLYDCKSIFSDTLLLQSDSPPTVMQLEPKILIRICLFHVMFRFFIYILP